ncbi:MAG: hypothetical protein GY716_08020 [bacterium]|nr:hypothetical protein [bacterium]
MDCNVTGFRPSTLQAILCLAMLALALFLPVQARAASTTDFEPAGFVAGSSVQAHAPDGTIISPIVSGTNPDAQAWSVRDVATDEEVVDISGTDPPHGKVWRLSDLGDTGNLQTRPHSPNSGEFHGETGAIDDFGTQSVTRSVFYGAFDFRSVTGAAQPGLEMNVSAACGDDCRHGFVRIIDDGGGFDLGFFDTGDNSGGGSCSSFDFSVIDLNLSYGDWHTLGIEIQFVDGFGPGGFGAEGNDVVNVWVDGAIVHSGTSWETCYAYVGSGDPRGVDRLQFYRNSTGQSTAGGGLYYDNVVVTDTAPAQTGLTLADATACEPPATAAVDVFVDTDGDPLDSLVGRVTFNAAELSFVGAVLTDFSAADYTLSAGETSPGVVDFTMADTGSPGTPAADEAVATLVFDVIGGSNPRTIAWDGGSTSLNGGAAGTLDDGSISTGPADVEISLPTDLSAAPGTTASVPVFASPADSLMSFDLTLVFDPAVLSFDSLDLVGLVTDGWTPTTFSPHAGQLRISLFDADAIPGGTGAAQIATLNFDVIGSLADVSPLSLVRAESDDGVSVCAAGGALEVCADADGDGATACPTDPEDCNDANSAQFPGNPEVCDGLDNDCNGSADFDAFSEADADLDGVRTCQNDCDDNDANNYPGNPEVCDGQDNDCSGLADFDAFSEADADLDGVRTCQNDCDDNDANNYPGNPEVCDGQDNDCNALADFDAFGETDTDGDLFRTCEGDCDDNELLAFPGNPEVCGDGVDNNCDGSTDSGTRYVSSGGSDLSPLVPPPGGQLGFSGGSQAGATNNDVGFDNTANPVGLALNLLPGDESVTDRDAFAGLRSWRYSRGYGSPGPGTPFSPTQATTVGLPGTGDVDTVKVSFAFKPVDAAGDGSTQNVYDGTTAGDDRTGGHIYLTSTPSGVDLHMFTLADLGDPDSFLPVDLVTGLDPTLWHTVEMTTVHGAGGDATLTLTTYVIDGVNYGSFMPWPDQWRVLKGFTPPEANAVKWAADQDGDAAFLGFYYDSIGRVVSDSSAPSVAVESWFEGFEAVGDAGNDCTDADEPCATIQHAIDQACDGDTIEIGEGSFAERLDIDKPLTLACAQAGVPGTDAGRDPGNPAVETIIDGSGNDVTIDLTSGGVTIDGCDITGDDSTYAGVQLFNDSADIVDVDIVNNLIHEIQAINPSAGFQQARAFGIFGVMGSPGSRDERIRELTIQTNRIFLIGDSAPVVGGSGVHLNNVDDAGAGFGALITNNAFESMFNGDQPNRLGSGVVIEARDDTGAPSEGVTIGNNSYSSMFSGVAVYATGSSVDEAHADFSAVACFVVNIGDSTLLGVPLAVVNEALLLPYARTSLPTGLAALPESVAYYPAISVAIGSSDPGAIIDVVGSFVETGIFVDRPVTLAGTGCGGTIVDGGGVGNIFTLTSGDVLFSNMTIRNGSQGVRYETATPVNNTEFNGVCFLDHTSRAIEIHNPVTATDMRVIGCQFDNSGVGSGHGIRMASSSIVDGLSITGTSFNVGSLGIYQANDGGTSTLANLHVDNCTFSGYTDTAVFAEEIRDSLIENSQFTDNERGITVFKAYVNGPDVTGFVVRGNTFTSNVDTALIMYVSQGTSSEFTFEGNIVNVDASLMNQDWGVIDVRVIPGLASSSALIRDNQVTFSGAFGGGAVTAHALKLRGSSNALVTGNTFDGGGVLSTGGIPGTSGIYIQADDGTFGPIAAGTVIDANLNTIVNFENGVSVYGPTTLVDFGGLAAGVDLNVNFNDISNNSNLGFESGAGETADANCNWWGDAAGPGPGPLPQNDTTGNVDTSGVLLANDFGLDTDTDTYGSCVGTVLATHPGGVPQGDCAPSDPTSNPGAVEVCDGDDNDCNDLADFADAQGGELDVDGDNYVACLTYNDTQGNDTFDGGNDCDETRTDVNPGEVERCDDTLVAASQVDHDCDGVLDEALPEPDQDCAAASGNNACQIDRCEPDDTCAFDASGSCGIAGRVEYNQLPDTPDPAKPVEGVVVTVTGDIGGNDTTDVLGDYAIASVAGNVTATPDKAEDANDLLSLSGQDSAEIAKYAVNLVTLSARQLVAGDVSNNSNVTSFDASLVAQKVVNPTFVFPVVSDTGSAWAFFDATESFAPIGADESGVDFVGVFYGDVTLSWEPSPPSAAGFKVDRNRAVTGRAAVDDLSRVGTVSTPYGDPVLPDLTPREEPAVLYLAGAPRRLDDGRVEYLLGLMNADGIQAIDFKLVGKGGASLVGVTATDIAAGYQAFSNDSSGEAAIAIFGVEPMVGTGEFLSIVVAADHVAAGFPFKVQVEANEGLIPVVIDWEAPTGAGPPIEGDPIYHLQANPSGPSER